MKGRYTMKKSNTNTANLTATESNLPTLTANAQSAVATLNKHLNTSSKGKNYTVIDKNSAYVKAANKALRELNQLLATEYYKEVDAVSVLRNGKEVPAMALTYDSDKKEYSLTAVKVYPTLQGMKPFLPEDITERVDVLRRCASYLAMDGMEGRELVLTGIEGENGKKGKDVPTEKAKAIMPEADKISNNAVKAMLTRIVTELTQGGATACVTSAMLKDFNQFCIKRTGEWGERAMTSQEHVGDIVLEYVHMTLSGKGNFTVKVG